jgi:formate-dependent phosphoribosylglycinamide formyltransferase (GAR transformylase)
LTLLSTEKKRRALLIAPDRSYRTGAFVLAAQKLGIELVVASFGEACLASNSGGLALNRESGAEALDAISRAVAENPFAAILASDDETVALAGAAAERNGLPGNPAHAIKALTSKIHFRRFCQSNDTQGPGFIALDSKSLDRGAPPGVHYPCVAKPATLSASRGVIRCDNPGELDRALKRIHSLLRSEGKLGEEAVLIEDYIDGLEYAVDGLLKNGRLQVLAIFEKPEPMVGPFFEETIYLTPPRLSRKATDQVIAALEKLCRKLRICEGALHAELRINSSGVWFLEIAGRTVGGRCGRILEFQTGRSLEELVLANAVRLPAVVGERTSSNGVMMIPVTQGGVLRRVEGISAARRVPDIVDVEIDVREGQILVPWPEGCAYPGFIFARAGSVADVERALRAAYRCLDFVLAPQLPITTGSQSFND